MLLNQTTPNWSRARAFRSFMLIYWAIPIIDKNWAVRAAALEAIAQVGDGARVPKIAVALDHEKDVVRFTAAACVAHLTRLPAKRSPAETGKP